MENLFASIYDNNGWSGKESRSGTGSDLDQTQVIREELPKLLRKYDIVSMLDIPCGDYWWFSHIKDLPEVLYIGGDIVQRLIWDNQDKYPDVDFRRLDITQDELPKVDLVLVRDMLGHFSQADVDRALANLRASGSRYLLTTTFTTVKQQYPDIETGKWRPVNMELMLGKPLDLIDEKFMGYGKKNTGKSLGLWELNHG